jgi:hypothetical protein
VTPNPGTTVAAWQPDFEPPSGFAEPVKETSATVTIVGAVASPSITIVGERGTVNGRSGVLVEGLAVNVDLSATLVPWVRLKGQTSYTAGSASVTTEAQGNFTWQRRTGKKVSVYFTTSD